MNKLLAELLKEKRRRVGARNNLLEFIKYVMPEYIVNWHHAALCDRLSKLKHERGKKIMIFVGPQRGKSLIVSRMFPAWWLGHFPASKNILSSYSGDLANSFNKDCQNIIGKEEYARIFPDMITGHRDHNLRLTSNEFHTSKQGYLYSVGATGATTGRSAGNIGAQEDDPTIGTFIGDDLIKDRAQVKSPTQMNRLMDWWNDVANTRIHKTSHTILMHTRWAKDDISGRIIDAGAIEDGWEIYSFPELGPDKNFPNSYDKRKENEPLWPEEKGDYDEIMKLKERVGSYTFSALYQQSPKIDGGNIIKDEWIQLYEQLPFNNIDKPQYIGSWDLTFKETGTSYVVGVVFLKLGANFYLVDIVRGKFDFVETSRRMQQLANKWPQCRQWLVEKAANGEAILSQLKNKISGMKGIKPDASKDERLHSVVPFFESGNVHVPANHPQTKTIIEELTTFPNASNDDIVDAISMALNNFNKLSGLRHLRAGVKA